VVGLSVCARREKGRCRGGERKTSCLLGGGLGRSGRRSLGSFGGLALTWAGSSWRGRFRLAAWFVGSRPMAMWTAQITSSERGRSDLFCSSATILVDLYDEYGATILMSSFIL
jgi:hypothetical protein